MKTRNLLAAVLCSVCLTVTTGVPVMADSSKIVTLGADLSDSQKNTMMKYFNTSSDQVQIIYVTNADERAYLGNYVPSEKIGTNTLSCAYVKPTSSGGIKVRTANLNYVTCNMIASALSTAGVTNCEVVAACPIKVSGTGALTGVMMAYENSTGTQLDSTKKDLATREVVVTGDVGQQVGQDNATNIINKAKLQIIGENVQNADEIYNIVYNIAVENNVSLSDDEMSTIVELLQEIAQQSYDIASMKETLEDIQQSLDDSQAAQTGEEVVEDSTEESEDDAEDITQTVDSGALAADDGTAAIEDSTEDAALASDTGKDTTSPAAEVEDSSSENYNDTGIPEATGDGTYDENSTDSADNLTESEETEDSSSEAADDSIDQDTIADENGDSEWDYSEESSEGTDEGAEQIADEEEGTEEASYDEAGTEESSNDLDTSLLSEDSLSKYEDAQKFFVGEYQADLTSLQSVMPEVADLSAVPALDSETAEKLVKELEQTYYDLLTQVDNGTFTYESDGTEVYLSSELNGMNKELKTIFGTEEDLVDGDILYNVSLEDRTTLYSDTLKFFEKLYDESSDSAEATDETSDDEAYVEDSEYADEYADDESYAEEETY